MSNGTKACKSRGDMNEPPTVPGPLSTTARSGLAAGSWLVGPESIPPSKNCGVRLLSNTAFGPHPGASASSRAASRFRVILSCAHRAKRDLAYAGVDNPRSTRTPSRCINIADYPALHRLTHRPAFRSRAKAPGTVVRTAAPPRSFDLIPIRSLQAPLPDRLTESVRAIC